VKRIIVSNASGTVTVNARSGLVGGFSQQGPDVVVGQQQIALAKWRARASTDGD
jgi:hypothetical protein